MHLTIMYICKNKKVNANSIYYSCLQSPRLKSQQKKTKFTNSYVYQKRSFYCQFHLSKNYLGYWGKS